MGGVKGVPWHAAAGLACCAGCLQALVPVATTSKQQHAAVRPLVGLVGRQPGMVEVSCQTPNVSRCMQGACFTQEARCMHNMQVRTHACNCAAVQGHMRKRTHLLGATGACMSLSSCSGGNGLLGQQRAALGASTTGAVPCCCCCCWGALGSCGALTACCCCCLRPNRRPKKPGCACADAAGLCATVLPGWVDGCCCGCCICCCCGSWLCALWPLCRCGSL